VLYAPDLRWWRVYGAEAEQTFKGERWSCSEVDGVNRVEAVDDTGLSLRPGRVHTGGNCGYQMLGLAFMWGAARIVLLGYDMQRGPKGESHHHGDHANGLPNCPPENLREWTRRFSQLAIDVRGRGIVVINATRRTALRCFEQMPIEVALLNEEAKVKTAALLVPASFLPAEHAALEAGLTAAGYREPEHAAAPDVSVVWGCAR
jgi:hypothetical protein